MPNQKNNKRQELRVGLKDVKAELTRESGLFASLQGTPKALPVINISLDGVRLLSKNKLETGKELSLSIMIPSLGAKPIKVDGQVTWTKQFKPFNTYLIGIKFDYLSLESKKRLYHLVNFLGNKSGKILQIIKGEKRAHGCEICQFAKDGKQSKLGYYIWQP
jgi:hypothetical protein